jgi:hypothetical protein
LQHEPPEQGLETLDELSDFAIEGVWARAIVISPTFAWLAMIPEYSPLFLIASILPRSFIFGIP